MFSYVSEFHKAHAFSLGGGGGASPPQPSSGGSPQISSGKTSPPQPSSGGSPQISSGKTSTIKQPNCVSQGSCTGTNDATNLTTTTNAESKNTVQGGSVTVKPNQGGSANVNTNPKAVTNPSTAIITNPDVAVNQNNVDVNVTETVMLIATMMGMTKLIITIIPVNPPQNRQLIITINRKRITLMAKIVHLTLAMKIHR